MQKGGEALKARIRELRRERRLSQEELADAVGTTRQTITSIEVGRYTASRLLAVQIFRPFAPVVGDAHYADFLAGIQVGLLAGLALVAVCVLVKSAVALRGERKARALIIRENDERSLFIAQKTGMSSYKYVAAGYFSAAVMAALLCAALFEVAVRAALYACCARKL